MAQAVAEPQGRLIEVEAGELERAAPAPAGEGKAFRFYDPDQVLLMAPVLSDWVPEGDLAHFVSDLVEAGELDLSAVYASYESERGFPPYDPRLMLKLLIYGYATWNAVFAQARGGDLSIAMSRYGCCAPISTLTIVRSLAFAVAIWRRSRGCSWGRCACARRRALSSSARSRSMAPS